MPKYNLTGRQKDIVRQLVAAAAEKGESFYFMSNDSFDAAGLVRQFF